MGDASSGSLYETAYGHNAKISEYRYWLRVLERETCKAETLPKGELDIQMKYTQESTEYGGGGTAQLFVNGQKVGEGAIEKVVPARYSATETMDIGKDLGSTVSPEYKAPFAYTGGIQYVKYKLD